MREETQRDVRSATHIPTRLSVLTVSQKRFNTSGWVIPQKIENYFLCKSMYLFPEIDSRPKPWQLEYVDFEVFWVSRLSIEQLHTFISAIYSAWKIVQCDTVYDFYPLWLTEKYHSWFVVHWLWLVPSCDIFELYVRLFTHQFSELT